METHRTTRAARIALACMLAVAIAGCFGLTFSQPAEAATGSYELQSGSISAGKTVKSVELYRLYNRFTSEHLYTTDASERDVLMYQDWRYEGTACTVPASGTNVYRLYNPYLGLHHYCTDARERDVLSHNYGWKYEGVAWHSDPSKTVKMYRLYNPSLSQHHYTTSKQECDTLASKYGWRYEGEGWSALKLGTPATNVYGNPNVWRSKLRLTTNFNYPQLFHGSKPASCQKYIVLHDTEGDGNANIALLWWVSNGRGVATHFVVNKDGSILQCVPMDTIAHHAGLGTSGHNRLYGVDNSSRDDVRNAGNRYSTDYGMNSYSIGIEMVHSGNNPYPAAQLQALDTLINYIDAYYGFESTIIDHKMWRIGNSDTSAAFSQYLANYRSAHRSYR